MKPSYPLSVLLAVGLALLYIGERIVDAGTQRWVFSGLGVAALLLSLVLRVMRSRTATAGSKQIEQALLGLSSIAVAAVMLYFVQSDVFTQLDGQALATGSPKLAGALLALFPALLVVALLPTFLMELAYVSMARSKQVEVGRVRDAMLSGLGLAAVLLFGVSVQYVVSERDKRVDLSYFRTTKAGDATRKLVASLTDPIEVYLFFPTTNDVGEQVSSYFEGLKPESKQLTVKRYDHALEPKLAKELNVAANGSVVMARGARKEAIFIGLEIDKARNALRTLDNDIYKKLVLLAKSKKTIYLTTGHGERAEDSRGGENRAAIELIRGELKGQNYELKKLSAAEGLANEIPKDAAAVMIMGPMMAFSPPEAKALEEYEKKGGRLFIAVDPESGLDFKELMAPLGLKFNPVTLANDVKFARKSYTLADRTIIATNSFSSHAAVTTSGRGGFPFFAMAAGSLDEVSPHPAEISIDFAVRADSQTWNDLNNNFNYDPPGEMRKAYNLAAAVTRRAASGKSEEDMRVVVVGDSDAVADEVLQLGQATRGDAYLVLDSLKWLFGEEAQAGAINSETDGPITRTRGQEAAWFYGTIFLGPALVLAIGVFARRRSRAARAASSTTGPAPLQEVKP